MAIKQARRKLYEYIVEEIGLRILKGEYKVGQTLPNEETLSKELDISRGVLREATKVLTQKGLIRTRPKIGTQVTDRTQWNLFDPEVLTWKLLIEDKSVFFKKVTEVRRIIESEAARYAAERSSDEAVARIGDCLDAMLRFVGSSGDFNYETYLAKDMAFHSAVMDSSNNELLSQIAFTMRQALHTARQMDVQDPEIQRQSMGFHEAIYRAIRNRDPQAAYRASQEMFDQIWQTRQI
jgi:GntR family transcriptional regulator, galactonate operon transcriptional repressor